MRTLRARACLLVLLFVGGCRSPGVTSTTVGGPGAVEAKRDISNGVLALENIGCPTHIPLDVADVLQRKYGIQVRLVAFDMFSDEEYEHVEAYNGVMRSEIERRFGKGVWNAASDEAVRLHETKTVPNTGN